MLGEDLVRASPKDPSYNTHFSHSLGIDVNTPFPF